MRNLLLVFILAGCSLSFVGCGKKEPVSESPMEPTVETVAEPSFEEHMHSASEQVEAAASSFKKTADQTAREVGGAVKGFGAQIGKAFKKAKNDLEK